MSALILGIRNPKSNISFNNVFITYTHFFLFVVIFVFRSIHSLRFPLFSQYLNFLHIPTFVYPCAIVYYFNRRPCLEHHHICVIQGLCSVPLLAEIYTLTIMWKTFIVK
jgi:hypothetical protein